MWVNMINLRRSIDRGHFDFGWLKTQHTFSFADYFDANHMGFRTLRVINQDIVAPNQGFGLHAHKNMEIITYVLKGAVKHKDSMGNETVIKPGEIQRMSAGTGVKHSEFNASASEDLELLQIWILPEANEITPSYEQVTINKRIGELQLIAAHKPTQGAVKIHQDVQLYAGFLAAEQKLNYQIAPQRYVWIQLIKGELAINDTILSAGDGVAVSDEIEINLSAQQDVECLLFNLN
jgi:redox-sensitive bicupin YhaK (pirin superfamily)